METIEKDKNVDDRAWQYIRTLEKEVESLREIVMLPDRPEYPGLLKVGQELIDRNNRIRVLSEALRWYERNSLAMCKEKTIARMALNEVGL